MTGEREGLFADVRAGLANSDRGVTALRSLDAIEARFQDLRERGAREPLGVDISDYSDEFCAGFLAGQANALDEALRDA